MAELFHDAEEAKKHNKRIYVDRKYFRGLQDQVGQTSTGRRAAPRERPLIAAGCAADGRTARQHVGLHRQPQLQDIRGVGIAPLLLTVLIRPQCCPHTLRQLPFPLPLLLSPSLSLPPACPTCPGPGPRALLPRGQGHARDHGARGGLVVASIWLVDGCPRAGGGRCGGGPRRCPRLLPLTGTEQQREDPLRLRLRAGQRRELASPALRRED